MFATSNSPALTSLIEIKPSFAGHLVKKHQQFHLLFRCAAPPNPKGFNDFYQHFATLWLGFRLSKSNDLQVQRTGMFVALYNNESLLSSPFLNRFFDRNLQSRSNEIRLKILEEFEHNVKCCYDELDKILSDTPLAWEPNPGYLKSRLEAFFSAQWLKDCRDYFTKLYFINIKSN